MKKKVFLVSMLLSLFKLSEAATVPVSKALEVARFYLSHAVTSSTAASTARLSGQITNGINKNIGGGGGQPIDNTPILLKTDYVTIGAAQYPAYYIFGGYNGIGFTIVAGDDASKAVVGFSLEDQINVNNLPENFKYFLETIKLQIQNIKSNNYQASTEINNSWNVASKTFNTVYDVVPSLLKSKWNQNPDYNNQSPNYNKFTPGGSVTGCVATAMAQIMRYWNHPSQGYNYHGYGSKNFGWLSADFGNTTYDWAAMPNKLTGSSPVNSVDAVATLSLHCGIAVDMDYSINSSGAYVVNSSAEDAHKSYLKYFKYPSVNAKVVENYSGFDQNRFIKTELDNSRPVQIGANGTNGAHSWVIDGYTSEGLYHMNWGWGGYCDGNFELSALNPDNLSMNIHADILIGIQKPFRLAAPSISGNPLICNSQTETYTINGNAAFQYCLIRVPAGWVVNGIVSDNQPITVYGNSFNLSAPSSNYQGVIDVIIRGVANYGETSLTNSFVVTCGKPKLVYKANSQYGIGEFEFSTDKTGDIQRLANGSWTSEGSYFSTTVKYPLTRTITIRVVNACGITGPDTYNLYAYPDPNDPIHGGKRFAKQKTDAQEETSIDFQIYPNPSKGDISLTTAEAFLNAQIKIYSIDGKLVLSDKVNSSNQKLNLSEYGAGLYLIQLISPSGEVVQDKIVIE